MPASTGRASTSTGRWPTTSGNNLLKPGDTPHDNAQFLLFLVAVIRAVARHGDLLRVSVATAHNDHRLGANEAPPAIISIFLGDMLQDIVEQIEKGGAKSAKAGGELKIGVSVLPTLPRDPGDRNRTSPFAFTGNKFEFRAVGSSQSVSGPIVVLNTIVAESLDEIATQLEQAVAAGKDLNAEIQALASERDQGKQARHLQRRQLQRSLARRGRARGLPNRRTSIESLPDLLSPKSVKMFGKYGVFNERELHSRFEILVEGYRKTINIESQLTIHIAKRMILPAALRYQTEVAQAISSLKATGATVPKSQAAHLSELVDGDRRTPGDD